ncbi:MAG: hypothetical protein ABSD21_00565 [Rhizomicrobium sp.]|jgi:hypothetical protein
MNIRKGEMRIVIALLAFVLAGCATEPDPYAIGNMLPGTITSLSDGKIFPAQAEISTGSGKMTATNPVTGEVFEGRYTALQDTHVVQNVDTSFWGNGDTSQSVETSDIAHGSAVLIGNKGTVLNIKLEVKAGHPPSAYGDAEDNNGKKYNVQF